MNLLFFFICYCLCNTTEQKKKLFKAEKNTGESWSHAVLYFHFLDLIGTNTGTNSLGSHLWMCYRNWILDFQYEGCLTSVPILEVMQQINKHMNKSKNKSNAAPKNMFPADHKSQHSKNTDLKSHIMHHFIFRGQNIPQILESGWNTQKWLLHVLYVMCVIVYPC